MREVEEAERQQEPGEIRDLREVVERAERVGALPVELAAMLLVERFRQDEHAIAEVDARQDRRGEERPARIELTEEAADGRPEDEAEAEGGPQHAEGLRALVRLGHVGDVGGGG